MLYLWRIPQSCQFLRNRFHRHRLADITAGAELERFGHILAVSCHKDDIHLGIQDLQLLGHLHTRHGAHLYIQKGNVTGMLLCKGQQLLWLVKRR